MGCVMYYVLTSGCHPFDPPLSRQANIKNGSSDLSSLSGIGTFLGEVFYF